MKALIQEDQPNYVCDRKILTPAKHITAEKICQGIPGPEQHLRTRMIPLLRNNGSNTIVAMGPISLEHYWFTAFSMNTIAFSI